jgi:inner membrane protein
MCDPSVQSVQAAMLAAVLAAELPDIDYLLPADDAVLHTLQAHRGFTHALIFAPVVALIAAAIAKAIFRDARFGTFRSSRCRC